MRNLVLLALTSSVLSTADTEACGTPEPQVLRLVPHRTYEDHSRMFALTSDTVPSAPRWQGLPVAAYDTWQLAPAGPASVGAVTLIGPSGTRVVTPSRRVVLRADRELPTPSSALELPAPDGDFRIALWGKHRASWIELESIADDVSDAAVWLIGQHVNAYGAGSLGELRIAGTQLTAVTITPPHETKPITFVRSGKASLGRYDGMAVGAFVADGTRYLLLYRDEQLRTVAL